MDGCMHACMHGCMYVCMYVCVCRQWMRLNMGLDVSQDGLQCSGFMDTWGVPNFNHHLFSSSSKPGFKCFSEQLQDHQYLRY